MDEKSGLSLQEIGELTFVSKFASLPWNISLKTACTIRNSDPVNWGL